MDPANTNMNNLGNDESLTDEERTQRLIEARAQTLDEARHVAARFRQAHLPVDSRIVRTLYERDGVSAAEEVDGWFIGWTDLDVEGLSDHELLAGTYPGLLLAEDGSLLYLLAAEYTTGGEEEPANIFHVDMYDTLGSDPTKDTSRIVLLRPEDEAVGMLGSREYDPLQAEVQIREAIQFLESLASNS